MKKNYHIIFITVILTGINICHAMKNNTQTDLIKATQECKDTTKKCCLTTDNTIKTAEATIRSVEALIQSLQERQQQKIKPYQSK